MHQDPPMDFQPAAVKPMSFASANAKRLEPDGAGERGWSYSFCGCFDDSNACCTCQYHLHIHFVFWRLRVATLILILIILTRNCSAQACWHASAPACSTPRTRRGSTTPTTRRRAGTTAAGGARRTARSTSFSAWASCCRFCSAARRASTSTLEGIFAAISWRDVAASRAISRRRAGSWSCRRGDMRRRRDRDELCRRHWRGVVREVCMVCCCLRLPVKLSISTVHCALFSMYPLSTSSHGFVAGQDSMFSSSSALAFNQVPTHSAPLLLMLFACDFLDSRSMNMVQLLSYDAHWGVRCPELLPFHTLGRDP